MHVHPPTPFHGWREFLSEVAIIVLGVLLALVAEQAVASLHERSAAEETRGTLRTEFNQNLAALARRRDAEPCVERRLDELRALFFQWAKTGQFKTPQWVSGPPVSPIGLSRYDAAVSAGRLALLSNDEQYRIGSVASGLRIFQNIELEERQVWGRLRAMQAGPDALSTADRALLRIALQDASTLDYEARLAIEQQLPRAREFGYSPDLRSLQRTMGHVVTNKSLRAAICLPIDTPRDQAQRNFVTPMPL